MNVKKFLKKKAQEDIQSVQTEHDQEVLQCLKNSVVEEKPKTRRNMKWLWAVSSGAVACAVAAVLIVELVPRPNNGLGGVRYDEMNFQRKDSDFSELSNALTDLTLHFTEDQEVSTVKFFDSLSGDDLYYVLTIAENSTEAIYNMEFMIIVNENYDYENFNLEGEVLTETYADYTIVYQQKIIRDPDIGLNTITGSAKIESAKYEMYVLQYEEYSFGDGTFLTVINNMLKF